MNILYESATLESTTRLDGSKYWRIKAYRDESGCFTQTESWKTTKAGESKHVFSTPSRVEAKNVGRSNQTTPEQQAVAEAKADEQLKKDKGYWVLGEGKPAEALPLPMLAEKFSERKKHIQYPCAVQPKVDGARMLFDGAKGWTRQGNLVLPGVIEHLLFDTGGVILDGELMLPHDEFGFEKTSSAIKRVSDLSKHLVYYVYDIADEGETYRERHLRLQQVAKTFPKQVQLVETRIVNSEAGVMEAHGEFVEQGHEGAMARNLAGAYRFKDRTNDLQKVKEFQDDEYEIVGVEEGTAKFEGCAIMVLKTKDGKEFRATPKMSAEEKRALYQRRAEVIGKLGTVVYQNLSPDGIPRFPIFHSVRDYE